MEFPSIYRSTSKFLVPSGNRAFRPYAKEQQTPKQHCIGEICDSDDNVDHSIDLVDLYLENCGGEFADCAIENIFDQYRIPPDTFSAVPIDDRTNWDIQPLPLKDKEIFQDAAEQTDCILFESHGSILGAVSVDEQKGLIPYTLWKKGIHAAGRQDSGHVRDVPASADRSQSRRSVPAQILRRYAFSKFFHGRKRVSQGVFRKG